MSEEYAENAVTIAEGVKQAQAAGFTHVQTLAGWEPLETWAQRAKDDEGGPFGGARIVFDQNGSRFVDAPKKWLGEDAPCGIWPLCASSEDEARMNDENPPMQPKGDA